MVWTSIDHTGDLGIEIRSTTLDGLFEEAVRGFTDSLTDVARVEPEVVREVALEAAGLDLLLVDWLDEALYLFETESLVVAGAEVEVGRDPAAAWRLRARIRGEPWNDERHQLKVPIKAVTYHALEVTGPDGGWRATVVFDI